MPLDDSLIDRALRILNSHNFLEPDPIDLEACTQWVEIKKDKGKAFNPSQEIYKNIYDTPPPSNFGNPKSALELCLKIREVKGAPPISNTDSATLTLFVDSLTNMCEAESMGHVASGALSLNMRACTLCDTKFPGESMRSISAITMTSAFKNRLLPKDEDLQRILKDNDLTMEQYQESVYNWARGETSNSFFCPSCASRVIEKASVGKKGCAVALVLLMAIPTLLLSTALVWAYGT